LSDGRLGSEPLKGDFESFKLRGDDTALHTLWIAHREEVMTEWTRERRGSRPSLWWKYDAPRMSEFEVAAHGWTGCFWVPQMCEPRKRLSGIGDPAFEHLGYVPTYDCGIPAQWLTGDDFMTWPALKTRVAAAFDPTDPPKFESQATYLQRHGLFEPGEERRLKPRDFEPEIINFEEEEIQ